MSDIFSSNPDIAKQRRERVNASLKRRHFNEAMFHGLGVAAIVIALGLVSALFWMVISKGYTGFTQATVLTEVYFDPDILKFEERPVPTAGQSEADARAADLAWQRKVTMANWNKVVEGSLRSLTGNEEISSKNLLLLVENNERHKLRDMFVADPSLMGKTVPVKMLGSANIDNWVKGAIDRSLPDNRQQLPADIRKISDDLMESGKMRTEFNWGIFTNVDSRAAPASAGLAGAFVGSLYMMLIVIILAVPIGVAAAIYLEEFAPKNKLTDIIEVNINNLAAVPSIVFGLLGAAVFINYFKLPLSAPFVGGLVLTLMTLPTIIIATRSSLRAVSPSLRQAALGLGASKTQMVFHHVLPVTLPGILTATIIGVAQALGETAPLLLIGMNAFVAQIPMTPLDQSSAMPVQIYLWQGNENRNFFDPRTSSAIMVLLGLMITLNAIAVLLRQRLERKK